MVREEGVRGNVGWFGVLERKGKEERGRREKNGESEKRKDIGQKNQ